MTGQITAWMVVRRLWLLGPRGLTDVPWRAIQCRSFRQLPRPEQQMLSDGGQGPTRTGSHKKSVQQAIKYLTVPDLIVVVAPIG